MTRAFLLPLQAAAYLTGRAAGALLRRVTR